MITAEQLREMYEYDSATGALTRRSRKKPGRPPKYQGRRLDRQYHRINIEGKMYLAHRLAWLYVHGVWPQYEIDHIDGDKSNNAIANLRDVEHEKNQQNQIGSRFGVKRNRNRWSAYIQINKSQRYLGIFSTEQEASAAYMAAKADVLSSTFSEAHQ